MGFFRRFVEGLGHSTPVAGIAEAASSWGWDAVDEPFHGGTTRPDPRVPSEPCTELSGPCDQPTLMPRGCSITMLTAGRETAAP